MRKLLFLWMMIVPFILGSGLMIRGATYRYFGPHVTAQAPWINSIVVYNNGDAAGTFKITVHDAAGAVGHQQEYVVPATSFLALVMSNDAGYIPGPAEVSLTPVEGTFVIDTDNPKIKTKVAFRYGDSVSLCEFFLSDTLGWEFILPNTVQAHLAWTGLSLMNPFDGPLTVWVEAFQDGVLVGQSEIADIPPGTKYVRLSDGFWPGLGYDDYDQVRIYSLQQAFPPPMSITGNNDQDRHLFFNAAVTALTNPFTPYDAGDLYATDSIVGNLFFVPAGSFTQGSPADEPCRFENEGPRFTHVLSRHLAVMETEVTRRMWEDLRAWQPDLPADPSNLNTTSGLDDPVQYMRWREALLFANLLSSQQGLSPCYYVDSAMTDVLTVNNYVNTDYYCDFDADGYRLPTEGEWEYFCRAGTDTPFWVEEPDYVDGTCAVCTTETMPNLESVAVFCANRPDGISGGSTAPAGSKAANPWNLKDVHGNVKEYCWDLFIDAYPSGTVTDYVGWEAGNTIRVMRGGSFVHTAQKARSAYRDRRNQSTPGFDIGFRLVRTVE
ncbi:MAG: SUMF1/EgtB/PvdO family nonheme iron enzyme [Acidobacteria bacterium]|nr:SUMF1/EgtB/PvdO family nonheme iron enzyme [Acidobacteriota bacterium]